MASKQKNQRITQGGNKEPEVPAEAPKVETPKEPEKKSQLEVAKQAGLDIKALVQEIKDELKDEIRKELDERIPLGQFLAPNSDPEIRRRHLSKAEAMKEHLAKQPKKSIIIPISKGEKRGKAIETVILNGYRYEIQKGVYVDVPEQVAEVIMNHYQQTEEALDNEFRLDKANEEKAKALAG